MNTGIVGAGRLGTAFALFLGDHGHPVRYVTSRTEASGRAAAELAGAAYVPLQELAGNCQRIIITTPDDQITAVAAELSGYDLQPDAIVLHMSGALGSDALAPLRERGCRALSLHPFQTIPDAETGRTLLGRAIFTIEGDQDAELETLLSQAGVDIVRLEASDKARYHAAACMVSGYVDTLASLAAAQLVASGFEKRQALDALLPMLEGAISVLRTRDPAEALTGPIARGDAQTIAHHLAALSGETADVYRALGLATTTLAASGGTDPAALAPIVEMLSTTKESQS